MEAWAGFVESVSKGRKPAMFTTATGDGSVLASFF